MFQDRDQKPCPSRLRRVEPRIITASTSAATRLRYDGLGVQHSVVMTLLVDPSGTSSMMEDVLLMPVVTCS